MRVLFARSSSPPENFSNYDCKFIPEAPETNYRARSVLLLSKLLCCHGNKTAHKYNVMRGFASWGLFTDAFQALLLYEISKTEYKIRRKSLVTPTGLQQPNDFNNLEKKWDQNDSVGLRGTLFLVVPLFRP